MRCPLSVLARTEALARFSDNRQRCLPRRPRRRPLPSITCVLPSSSTASLDCLVNSSWAARRGAPEKKNLGAPGGPSRSSVRRLSSAQVMISQFVGSSPESGSGMTVQSLLGIPSLPSVSLPCLCPLSLSKEINFQKKEKEKPENGICYEEAEGLSDSHWVTSKKRASALPGCMESSMCAAVGGVRRK